VSLHCLGARASRPRARDAGILPHLGARASRPHAGNASILPRLGARASRPHARDAGIPPRLGARASCPPGSAGILPAWDRGRLVRIGSAGISPLTPREGGTSSPYRGRFLGGACVPYLVLGFRTPKLPLLPSWEKGVGGMRGKSARECSKLRIASKNAPLEQRRTGTLFRPLKKPCSRC
jgi:hypothetical protein